MTWPEDPVNELFRALPAEALPAVAAEPGVVAAILDVTGDRFDFAAAIDLTADWARLTTARGDGG